MISRSAFATAAAFTIVLHASAGTRAEPAPSTIETIAGHGEAGNADGAAALASFLAPDGVAVAADGTIAVSDEAGQRIRTIRDGRVQTLAGGGDVSANGDYVLGAYADGNGAAARFDQPGGLAYLPDGTLLVADRANHCIRAIRGATVSTFAGTPLASGKGDGPAATATFSLPRGLAVDANGNVYVADDGSGLREISGGVVSTIALPDVAKSRALAVAIAGSSDASRIFVSTFAGLVIVDRATGRSTVYGAAAEGLRPFGYPDALLALGNEAVAFTDAEDQTVRLFWLPPGSHAVPLVVPLPGDVIEDGANNGGGIDDGPLRGARFTLPEGIARTASGDVIIADTGNRRVRSIHTDAFRVPFGPNGDALPNGRTWIVGGTASYYDTLWPDSIPGVLATTDPRDDVEAMQYDDADPVAIEAALTRVLATQARRVVWILTSREAASFKGNALAALLGRLSLHRNLTVCVVPLADDIQSARSFATLNLEPGQDLAGARMRYGALRATVRDATLHVVDLTDVFQRHETGSDGGALFATLTPDLTDLGRATVARALTNETR